MNKLAEMVQAQLLDAIEKDDLVLPTLPEVALSIREAAEDSEISVAALSKVIGRDAALSARLIKVCARRSRLPTCTPPSHGWASTTAATWPSAW